MNQTPQIVLLVEGQTEEAFVTRVLQPHVGYSTAYLTPIVVHTSRAANGAAFRGGGSWSNYRNQLMRLLSQPHWFRITTLIDYYGYPADAPQCDCTGTHQQPACVRAREEAIKSALPYDERFVPFVALHEFETLVIAAGATGADVLGDSGAPAKFRALVDEHSGNAELINDGPATAPSKRVQNVIAGYSKVRDGIAILESGFDSGLAVAPRFRDWVCGMRQSHDGVAQGAEGA